ncbi:MAG: polyamine ABC transporter ATP-binding protein [Bacteroidales bacterium]|nr:polyamine ABC transporter ATP-binding protein [Bacteroidales bacterium]MBR1500937.1 polyamine ABC transporter ATP-binding protein [Bacteroidales bacterium]
MAKKIIDIRGVSKSFGGKTVLKDINLFINQGEFLTLLGPSGCGKTTLLRMIAGFLQPDEGSILLDGKELGDTPPHLRPLNTVFQRYALFPHLDVYDNIAFGLKLKGVPEDEIEKRVRKVLKLVVMSDYEDRDVETLSGGQQQRIAIARAIVNQPKVLLLDEPLAALDLKMRKDMQIELKEMHRKLGITFIYVTHDQEEALTLSDTIVVMNEGRIQQIGTPIDIYNEPVNAFVADFIGESNILNGTMIRDRRVSFIGHDFDCVDEGFGENTPVDVVVRPEDIYFTTEAAKTQFTATVKSCIFKGVHYEMFVDTDTGNELMIQDYDPYPVGSTVQLYIDPDDIQVMKKQCTANELEGTVAGEDSIELLDGTFECNTAGYAAGDKVRVEIPFDAVDLQDDCDAGELTGEIHFILYKGDHYHLTVKIDGGGALYVDTNDIWDKGDLVGVKIPKKKIRIVGAL